MSGNKTLQVVVLTTLVISAFTIMFSPMFWMGLLLAPLPPLVLGLLISPTLHVQVSNWLSRKKN